MYIRLKIDQPGVACALNRKDAATNSTDRKESFMLPSLLRYLKEKDYERGIHTHTQTQIDNRQTQ